MEEINYEKIHQRFYFLADCSTVSGDVTKYIPSDIQCFAATEINVNNHIVGYMYFMDFYPKEKITERLACLFDDFTKSVAVLISKHQPFWLEEESQNAELAIDLLHHIQYPIKRVSAFANEIHRSAEDLKDQITKKFQIIKPVSSTSSSQLVPESSASRSQTNLLGDQIQQTFTHMDAVLRTFKSEMKLLDELIENSFQLHLLRSPNLSKISCEYDYIMSLNKIPSYITFITNQFFHSFRIKPFPIQVDPDFEDYNQIYMHTSLLWITLYWCFFQLLFISPDKESKITLSINYFDNYEDGQGLECRFSLNEEDCCFLQSDYELTKLQNKFLQEKENEILGKLSYQTINHSFQHFLTIFNVRIDQKLFNLPHDTREIKEKKHKEKEKFGFYFHFTKNDCSLLHSPQPSNGRKWVLKIPLSISTNQNPHSNHFHSSQLHVNPHKKSSKPLANDFSTKYSTHSVVQRNNSVDLSEKQEYSRKLKTSRKPSLRSSFSGSPKSHGTLSTKASPERTSFQNLQATPENELSMTLRKFQHPVPHFPAFGEDLDHPLRSRTSSFHANEAPVAARTSFHKSNHITPRDGLAAHTPGQSGRSDTVRMHANAENSALFGTSPNQPQSSYLAYINKLASSLQKPPGNGSPNASPKKPSTQDDDENATARLIHTPIRENSSEQSFRFKNDPPTINNIDRTLSNATLSESLKIKIKPVPSGSQKKYLVSSLTPSDGKAEKFHSSSSSSSKKSGVWESMMKFLHLPTKQE